MSYTQSAILGVGTNYDGSKFSYPVKRYTKLFNSKFGRTLLEQDNTDRCVTTRLYQADKDGNKVTLIREKLMVSGIFLKHDILLMAKNFQV